MLMINTQVESASSRPISRAGTATAGMTKLDARRMQMLVNQRQKLEEELLALESEVMNLVCGAASGKRMSIHSCTGEEETLVKASEVNHLSST